MTRTKTKLRPGEAALGGWIMIGHPSIAEIMAGEGCDWIGVDLEHTSSDTQFIIYGCRAMWGTDNA